MGRVSITIISGDLTMGISTYYYRTIESQADIVAFGTDKYPIAIHDDGKTTTGCTPGTLQYEEYLTWVNAGNVGIALTI